MFHTKYLTWGEVGKMRYHLTLPEFMLKRAIGLGR